ncbi:hypothetical protein QZH41_002347 [Actinostola sp. cb2023]|nr:hypothetical protein QZH41_002347 [Actinostola sp. cb2023]
MLTTIMNPITRKSISELKCTSDFEKAFGQDGVKLRSMDAKKFDEAWRVLLPKLESKQDKPPGNIKEFSSWLANFQSSNNTQKLEIPGQYTGLSKPLPEYHVKIAGFDEKVLTMSSIRRPKRITIRGDDEKDYMFLVKSGEDLRLDQRIEQLFCMMNDILTADPACKRRNLRLRTYQVIPMTPR